MARKTHDLDDTDEVNTSFNEEFNKFDKNVDRVAHAKPSTRSLLTGIIVGVIVAFILFTAVGGIKKGFKNFWDWLLGKDDEPTITNKYVGGKLEDLGELTTQKLSYNGLVHYENGSIPFLNKVAYYMYYQGSVTAYVDMNEVIDSVNVNHLTQTVNVVIPKAKLNKPVIDPDSIEFIDSKNSLLKDEKESVPQAIASAENDFEKEADTNQLKKNAENHAKDLITEIITNAAPGYKVDIRVKGE